MHAYLTDAQKAPDYSDRPPVLIAGDSDASLDRAERTIAAAGVRVADRVQLQDAPERIGRQVAASALWVEFDADTGEPLDRLLDQIHCEIGQGRFPAIVAAPASLMDILAAKLPDSGVELVIDGDDAERAAVLGLAFARAYRPDRLSDVAADRNAPGFAS